MALHINQQQPRRQIRPLLSVGVIAVSEVQGPGRSGAHRPAGSCAAPAHREVSNVEGLGRGVVEGTGAGCWLGINATQWRLVLQPFGAFCCLQQALRTLLQAREHRVPAGS